MTTLRNNTDRYWKLALFACVALLSLMQSTVVAQPARIRHVLSEQTKGYAPNLGRDLWFTMAQNYEEAGSTGKFYQLFVTSPNNTTVNIQVTGGTVSSFQIAAEEVVSFRVPLSWEVTSSGTIENKAIRVWSKDADLTAYLLSRNPATSDGMFIIPTIGWGTEYIVAGFHSYPDPGFGWDYPSEFCLVANQDNTNIEVTPTADIRRSYQMNNVLHRKGETFTVKLNRGQVVQYQLVYSGADEGYDVTGTHVKSDKPIGVVGAAQCANIPMDFPWCDHVCDMIPPIRTWANTYYTAPFSGRKGGDGFLVISSVPGQKIYRTQGSVRTLHCQLSNKYEAFWRHDIDKAARWESDAPFLLAQYCNSTSYPDYPTVTNNGVGDPAMVVVNSVEQFTPTVIFQTPSIGGFQNFVNIVVYKASALRTKYDGVAIGSLSGATRLTVDDKYDVYRVASVRAGTHKVVSDTGVGVYIYGYGSYDSYAWSGSLGTRTFNDPDTIPPVATPKQDCFCSTVGLSDIHPNASRLSSFESDSIYNMVFSPDPNFIPGSGVDSSYYSFCVKDSSKEAYLSVNVYDVAGNQRRIVSTYVPQIAVVTPFVANFGSGTPGIPVYRYDTICNTGKVPFQLTTLKLLHATAFGFTIDSANTTDPIPVGGCRLIKLSFDPKQTATVTDTIVYGDECVQGIAIVVGSGGDPDFTVNDEDFGCVIIGDTKKSQRVFVTNPSGVPMTIVNVTVDDTRFTYDKTLPINRLPFTVLPGEKKPVEFSFRPDAVNANFTTKAHFFSESAVPGERIATLKGCGIEPGSRVFQDTTMFTDCGAEDLTFRFTYEATGSAQSQVGNVVSDNRDTNFKQLDVVYSNGGKVILPTVVQPSEKFYITSKFVPPTGESGTYTQTIYVLGTDGDTLGSVTATAVVTFRAMAVNKTAITFPTAPFGSTPTTQTFTVCNTADDDLMIYSVTRVPGPSDNSITIQSATINGVPVALPVSDALLKKGECLLVTVQFDPTMLPTPTQQALFGIATNACTNPTSQVAVSGGVELKGMTIQGFSQPAILSCTQATNDVVIASGQAPQTSDRIIAITIGGNNPANFTTTLAPSLANPIVVTGGQSLNIPVLFSPTPGGGSVSYSAIVSVTRRNALDVDTTLTALVTGTALGIDAEIETDLALTSTQTAKVGDFVSLPIRISFKMNGLTSSLQESNIRGARLVYTYNQDLLHIDPAGLVGAVKNLPVDWAVDPAQSSIAGGKLTLVLRGADALPDGITSLGDIGFEVMLPKDNKLTEPIELTEYQLQTDNNAPVSACVSTTKKDGTFTLIYTCGDSTLQGVMNGMTFGTLASIAPNPVSRAQAITFTYGTKVDAPVSLVLYDMLGNEVARVVDRVQHQPGAYQVQFAPTALANGTYTCRFSVKDYTRSEQVVIAR